MEDIVDTFEIISSEDKNYVVNVWKKRIYIDTLSSSSKKYIYGKLATLKTEDGYIVNQTDDRKFHILELDIECEKVKSEEQKL